MLEFCDQVTIVVLTFFFNFRKHFSCTQLILPYETRAHLLLFSFPFPGEKKKTNNKKTKKQQRKQTKTAKPLAQLPFFVLPGTRRCQVRRWCCLWSTPAILPHRRAVSHKNFPTSPPATESSLPEAQLFLLHNFSILCVDSSCKSHPITLKWGKWSARLRNVINMRWWAGEEPVSKPKSLKHFLSLP